MTHLRKIRKQRGLSQSALAKNAGVSFAQVSRYENGWMLPTQETAEKLAGVLEMTVSELFPNQKLKNLAGAS